ncbi:MAG: hypothetical protein HY951_14090 [Bacteroidia bacterium]|nr:hypothetical protein [Bacteroidia bacterium]
MGANKFTYKEFLKLFNISKHQFILKTKSFVYFIPINGYNSFNENGFVAHNETNGSIEILSYSDIIEVTVDSKKYLY